MRAFEDWELRLLRVLEGPLPLVSRPFAEIAEKSGVTEEQVLQRTKAWVADGTIRRFGARVNHRSVGYAANGMSVWKVSADQVEVVGQFMAAQPEVSHCYVRQTQGGWDYNLFAMIHGAREEDVRAVVQGIAQHTGIQEYDVLFSRREFKKSAPRYFTEDESL